MIPKILHFIWFGRNVPRYVHFAINAFQAVNEDFKIHFIYRDIKTVEEIIDDKEKCKNDDDAILRKCGLSILNQDELYIDTINHCKKSKLKFIQTLLDIYRLDVLDCYGGIYLDCDTFPVKKFDQQIMNNKSFIVTRHYNENVVVADYEPGDNVKIVDGPFKMLQGKIIDVDKEAGKANVSIDLFGPETNVELELTQFTKE